MLFHGNIDIENVWKRIYMGTEQWYVINTGL